MFRCILLGLAFLIGFEGECMKTISINLQGASDRNLAAYVANNDQRIGLRKSGVREREGVDSIDLTKGTFLIVLREATFPLQSVNIKDSDSGDDLFVITVEKTRVNGQPRTMMTRVGDLSGELCRQCAGGGNSFILVVGDNLFSVVQRQPYGSMQAFIPVFQNQ
jgi:hypothetical protein